METGPKLTPDNIPEKKDRKKELMEERHRNAITAFKLEQFLSKEEPLNGDYPTSRTPENREKAKVASERLRPILERLEETGLIPKQETISLVANNYIKEKVTAQRAEQDLKEELKKEGKEATPKEMGSLLFKARTGKGPKKDIEAIRQEGYFAIAFFDDEDYFTFIGDKEKDESGGLFHRKMHLSKSGGDTPRFLFVDTLLLRNGWGNRVLEHERQHFINNSVFNSFEGFSRQPAHKKDFPLLAEGLNIEFDDPTKKNNEIIEGLNGVKDELLARIRDGSDPNTTTDFFDSELYTYLRESFSPDERQEVDTLLRNIESELKNTRGIFDYPSDARAILVYHLIDIPLLKFPERIRAVTDFINSRIKEFTDFIPQENTEKTVSDKERRERLRSLRLDITGEAYSVTDIILGIKNMEIGDAERELDLVKEKIAILRKEYIQVLTR